MNRGGGELVASGALTVGGWVGAGEWVAGNSGAEREAGGKGVD